MCFLSNNIYDYYNVSQGKITIPGIDDNEEMALTDVSPVPLEEKPTIPYFLPTHLSHRETKPQCSILFTSWMIFELYP